MMYTAEHVARAVEAERAACAEVALDFYKPKRSGLMGPAELRGVTVGVAVSLGIHDTICSRGKEHKLNEQDRGVNDG